MAVVLPEWLAVVSGTTQGATNDHAPLCDGSGPQTAAGVWYRYSVPDVAITTFIRLCATSPAWDTQLAVFTGGGCGSLTCLVADDDGCPGSELSFIQFDGQTGSDILILVHGGGDATGAFTLQVDSGDEYFDCNDNGYPDGWEVEDNPLLDCFNPLLVTVPPSRGGPDGLLDTCQCTANWNRDITVNSADISAYLASWLVSVADATENADIDCSGQANSTDISAFLSRWIGAVNDVDPFDGCF